MKLQHLRHLLALEEHGSFVQAAAVLHISQPALSRSIQGLEAQVGAPLFVRDGHGVTATDLGRVLAGRARQIVGLTDALDGELVARRALAAEEFVVGAGPYPAASVVGEAAARFVAANTGSRLRIEVRNWDELLARLRSHELHLFVAEVSTLDRAADLEVQALSQRPLHFFARRGHPLDGARLDGIAEIFRFPTASPARIPPRLFDRILSKLGRPSARDAGPETLPSLQCTDMALVKKVVLGTDAVMVASLSCVSGELDRGELVALGTEPWLKLDYGIVTLRTRRPTPLVAAFRAHLLEAERAVAERERGLAGHVPAAR